MTLNYDKIDNIVVEGIDYDDYPDFCDAYIASATYVEDSGERELTERELEALDGDWVYERVWEVMR